MNRAICSGKFQIKGVDFAVLSDDEIKDIHYASLEILEKTGVYVEDDDAIDLFHSIGCRVDNDKKIVKIPHYLVEKPREQHRPELFWEHVTMIKATSWKANG